MTEHLFHSQGRPDFVSSYQWLSSVFAAPFGLIQYYPVILIPLLQIFELIYIIHFSKGPPFLGCQGELFFLTGSENVLDSFDLLTGLGLLLSPAIIKITVIINGIIKNTAWPVPSVAKKPIIMKIVKIIFHISLSIHLLVVIKSRFQWALLGSCFYLKFWLKRICNDYNIIVWQLDSLFFSTTKTSCGYN